MRDIFKKFYGGVGRDWLPNLYSPDALSIQTRPTESVSVDSELSEKPHVLTATGPSFLRAAYHLRTQRKTNLCLGPECVGTGTKFWKAEGFLYGVTNQTQGRNSIALLVLFLFSLLV